MTSKNTISDLNDDLKFLIACCQTDLREDDIEFIHTYLNTERFTLNALISLANQHGILPLVYKAIKKIVEEDSSRSFLHAKRLTPNAEILTELKAHYMSISQKNMLMSAELIRIMKLLEANNIEALAFKGPVLSQMAYGDITLRQFGDLDVLVKKEDIYKIDTFLKQESYDRLLALTPVQENIWIKYAHDLGLIHKGKGTHFEMHWSFLDEDYPMQVDLDDFWKETQKVDLNRNRNSLATFSNENLLLYLCIHGSKHLWERIEWIKDIDLLIQTQTIEWNTVMEKIKGSGFEKMVYLGLSLTASLFKTSLPIIIQNEIVKYPQINVVSTFIFETWSTPKSTFQKTKTMLKLFPGIKEQLLYLHKIILKPSFNEYWFIDLPKGMYWAYYLVRPYLLIKKYFSKSV